MNTLDDLRRTLDHHAHDVHDDVVHSRTAAVRGRAVVVRRRRAAGVAAVAALAVIGAVGLPQLPSTPIADPTGGAPDVRTALGWTYRFDDMVHSNRDTVRMTLDESDLPRLVSWATDGADQDVSVRVQYEGTTRSQAGDHDDHLYLHPGFEGTVVLRGPAGLSLAAYNLATSVSPDGVGSGRTTFREDVAGYDFLGAAAGEPGQASIEFDLVPEATTTWVGYYCQNLPRGYRMNVNWVGSDGSLMFGNCQDSSSFDPGGSAGYGFGTGERAGTPQTMRMWVTRRGEPVADGEIPDLRLGVGAYAASDGAVNLLGNQMTSQMEHDGHVWQLVDTAEVGAGQAASIEVPLEGEHLVSDAFRHRGGVRVRLLADGGPMQDGTTFVSRGGFTNTGGGGGGLERVPAGSTVSLDFGRTADNVLGSGLALYERID